MKGEKVQFRGMLEEIERRYAANLSESDRLFRELVDLLLKLVAFIEEDGCIVHKLAVFHIVARVTFRFCEHYKQLSNELRGELTKFLEEVEKQLQNRTM